MVDVKFMQKTEYVCHNCGAKAPKWTGQCFECQAWNTLTETLLPSKKSAHSQRGGMGYSGTEGGDVLLLSEIDSVAQLRIPSTMTEFDRVLGGGIVPGSVILMGGDPGIGKSTLLLQVLAGLSQLYKTLYVSGEESPQQIRLRAEHLHLDQSHCWVLPETQVERLIHQALAHQPQVMVVDSIQTIYTDLIQSAPGSVAQVRESTAQLVRFAKQHQVAVFLVGHVTKEGALAGPRVLEHMVDTVLYFEGDQDSRYRMIRAIKNRFGAVNELGVFAMTETGLKAVSNPSAIFLSKYVQSARGSVVMATWEGSRPLLVEVQALVDDSQLANPRRVTVGLEQNRLSLILAVLHQHGGVFTYHQDVFVNIVGGVRVVETAADLAVLLAVLSSLKNKAMPNDCIVFGEVGLAGEIRPVQSGQERIKEAIKQGFKKIILPAYNAPKIEDAKSEGITLYPCHQLHEAIQIFYNLN